MPQTPEQTTIISELYRRRDALDPEKRAVVDELAKRYKLTAPAGPSGTLVESRQNASAGEYRQNQPESTLLTRSRESVLGGFEALGGDVESPVIGTAKNVASGVLQIPEALKTIFAKPVETGKAIASGITEGPRNIIEGIATGDGDLIAKGGGQTGFPMLASALGARKVKVSGESIADTIRAARGDVPKKQLKIEELLAPKGKEAKATAMQVAADLAKEHPTIAKLNQVKFDKRITQDFRTAQNQLKLAETLVPQGTVVKKAAILDKIQDVIDEQSPFAANPELMANPRAAEVLKEWGDRLDKLPDDIPFDELRKFRQQLDDDIASHRGWNETANIADQSEMRAKQHVVNAIRSQLKGISPQLDKADTAYSKAVSAIGASGIDPKTGRRVMDVGKKPEPGIIRRNAGKIATATGAGIAGYEINRRLD